MQVPSQPLPTVAPQVGGLPQFTQQASPEAAGASVARALGGAGDTLGRAADQTAQHALAFQELDNETHAKEAATQFDRQTIDLAFDPQGGYFTKMGRDAVDGYNDALDGAQKIRQAVLDSLPNDRSRLMADQVIVRKMGQLQESMAQHAAQQRRVWIGDTSKARVQSTVDDGVNFYNDNARWGQTIATVKGEVLSQGEMNGWSPETTANAQRDVVSKAWTQRIERMATDDPLAARDLYRANIGAIDGATHTAVERMLKAATLPVETRGLANRVLAGHATPDTEALTNAVIQQESGGDQAAVSGKGAIGIMQLMPDTARDVAASMKLPFDADKLAQDADYNKALGAEYLRQMLQRYNGNQTMALAAYNAGPGRVDQWAKMYGDPNQGQIADADWAAKLPIKETRDYVAAINAKVPTKPGTMPTSQDVRAHLADWIDSARASATAMFPNNPEAVDQTVSHVVTYASQITHGAQFQEKAARDLLLTRALGLAATPDGGYARAANADRPASLEQLLSGPAERKAWATMDPVQQQGILAVIDHNAKGTSPPLTDDAWSKFYELQGQAARDPTAFGNVNLADKALLDLLPHPMTEKLMSMQAQLQTKQSRDLAKGENLQHALAIAKPMLMAAGIPVTVKSGTKQAATLDQFTGRLDGELAKFMETNKKTPGDGDVRAMVNSLLVQGSKIGGGWLYGDSAARNFQVDDASQFKVTVPPVERPKIMKDFKAARGRDPTDGEIGEIYTAHLLRGGK